MARPSDSKELSLFAKPPLLITESAEDFASLSAALAQDIKPRGIVEQIYVDDIAALVWEIRRLRRCKAAIVNTEFENALLSLLNRLAGYTNSDTPEREEREALVRDWFSEPEAKKEVSELLAEYHLDESAIEAEAIRSLSEELEVLDRMLTSLESRRNRALRCIEDYQDRFARQVREVSDRVIEGKAVVQIENRSAREIGLTVATERQIAANRRNARKSTGPRSCAAKKRASRNAYRHGLTLSLTSSTAFAKRLDKLARKIADNSKSEIILQHARTAAQAVLDLARVRQVKVALIKSVSALGALGAPLDIFSVMKAYLYLELALEGKTPRGRPPNIPEPVDPLATMPGQEPARTVEAVRRALPQLRKLDRYESRAVARRDRAIREITKRRIEK